MGSRSFVRKRNEGRLGVGSILSSLCHSDGMTLFNTVNNALRFTPYIGGVKPLSDALTLNGYLKKNHSSREALIHDNRGLENVSRTENYRSC